MGTGREDKRLGSVNFPKIFNLSSLCLSKSQINLLNKGLKFTPTPKRNIFELKKDIETFSRKLRLVEFFAETENFDDDSLVRNKSTFNPPRNRERNLNMVIDFLNKQDFPERKPNNKSNLSKEEYNAMMELKNNQDIIIKEADKGGAVVIINTSHYVTRKLTKK